jgi:hypothetical protein
MSLSMFISCSRLDIVRDGRDQAAVLLSKMFVVGLWSVVLVACRVVEANLTCVVI